ncbi:MAG: substrate-binding domain-containing protein [Chloroflexota bacterium]|nr:substrate-binding domain-containing protein [Chloroflexota bacterium]
MNSYRQFNIFLLIIVLFSGLLIGCQPQEVTLEIYAGDGIKNPMEEIKTLYEAQNPHITLIYNFAASSALQTAMRTLEQGDLYIAEESDVESMFQDGLIIDHYYVASLTTTIVVREGDDIVTTWDDLAKEGVRITILNPELGGGGRAAERAINNSPFSEQIFANIITYTSKQEDTISLLLNNEVDAAIRPFFATTTGIRSIEVPEELAENFRVLVGITAFTQAEEEALAFAQFIIGNEGRQIFQKAGYSTTEQ